MLLKRYKVKCNFFLTLIVFLYFFNAFAMLSAKVEYTYYLEKGNFYLLQKEYHKALKYFLDGLKENPNSREIANNLGIVYKRMGDYRKAEKFYLYSIKLDPTYLPPRVNLCLLYYDSGNLVKISQQADDLLKYNPRAGIAYFAKGFVAYKRRKYGKAVKFLKKSLELAKKDSEYLEDAKVLLRKARMKANYILFEGR